MTCYFPMQSDVEEKFLHVLYTRNELVQMTVIYQTLADQFQLNRYERRGVKGDPKGSAWEYLVRQARKRLVELGWVHTPQRGFWALTDAGFMEARHRADANARQFDWSRPISAGPDTAQRIH
jgi:hypothetical protein